MNLKIFLTAFLHFAQIYCPNMPAEERASLPVAIYIGTAKDLKTASTFTGICQVESQMKVKHWFPDVHQNMDAAGTHNNTLCLELWREGLINDSRDWRKSRQWVLWRRLFQQRPDIGTMFAARAFTRLADSYGLENTVQIWKTGKVGTVPGILYKMEVDNLRNEILLYRR